MERDTRDAIDSMGKLFDEKVGGIKAMIKTFIETHNTDAERFRVEVSKNSKELRGNGNGGGLVAKVAGIVKDVGNNRQLIILILTIIIGAIVFMERTAISKMIFGS